MSSDDISSSGKATVCNSTATDQVPTNFLEGDLAFSLPLDLSVPEDVCDGVVSALEKFISYNVNLANFSTVQRVCILVLILISLVLTLCLFSDSAASDNDIQGDAGGEDVGDPQHQ